MGFFSKLATIFGYITVKEKNNLVTVTGLDSDVVTKLVIALWENKKVVRWMFTSTDRTGFTFSSFFIPDVVFMLTTILATESTPWKVKRSLEKVLDGIRENTWWADTLKPITPMIDSRRLSLLKWKPMPKQIEFLHVYGDKMPQFNLRGYVLAAAPGTGKAQPLDSKVLTPDGFIPMGNVIPGTMIVTPDGGTAKVSAIHPQGMKDIYRITFADGRSTKCCDDHLWKIHSHGWFNSKDHWRVHTFKDIRLTMEIEGPEKCRLYVPLVQPEIRPDADLPIDPYLMGILLGDGCMTSMSVGLATADEFIVDEVKRLLPEDEDLNYRSKYDYRFVKKDYKQGMGSSVVCLKLNELGLIGSYSHTKHIPSVYMNASYSQKIALLQGLMDADGTVDKTCSVSFCTTSEIMAQQVQQLIRGLGGMCRIREKIPTYTHNGEKREGRVAYMLNIRYRNPNELFRLPRKLERLSSNYQYAKSEKLKIASVEYIGKEPAQCISVDHPEHLYITDDYIVTHNTFSDLMVATCVIPPEIAEIKIIISPKKAVHLVWESTINKVFKKVPTYWCSDSGKPMPDHNVEYYVFHYEALEQALELAKLLTKQGKKYFTIVDESHNFNNNKSIRTERLVEIQTLQKDIYFLWASGSMILKTAKEMIAFLISADPRFDADAQKRFSKIYGADPGKAAEIFKHRLGLMMAFLVPKSEVSDTKPTIKELPVKIPESLAKRFYMTTVREEMKVYIAQQIAYYRSELDRHRMTVDQWFSWYRQKLTTKSENMAFDAYLRDLKILSANPDLAFQMTDIMAACKSYERRNLLPTLPESARKSFRNSLSVVKNIKLKVRGEALANILGRRRTECAGVLGLYCKPEDIISESLSKTLIFASNVAPVKAVADYLSKKGYSPVLIYGGTNSQLTQLMTSFAEDPQINPACATMASLSEAVPVIAASTIVLLNRPWRQGIFDQIVARADRLGQKYPVTVVEVTLDTGNEPNVSSTTDDILKTVRALINELVGPEFAGPDPSERQIKDAVDATKPSEDDDPSLNDL